MRRHCAIGQTAVLRREPNNKHDPKAIAVYLKISRLGGLLGSSHKKIGYIKSTAAKSLAKDMDSGKKLWGQSQVPESADVFWGETLIF